MNEQSQNPVMENILSRSSVRSFTTKKLPTTQIKSLLAAARAAPSANNVKPWDFVVVDVPQLLQQLADFHPHARALRTAPAAIVVCGQHQADKYWPLACAAATQNMLLAAHALGLGGVWLGLYPVEERSVFVQQLLGLPQALCAFALVAVGHPNPDDLTEKLREGPGPLHRNQWTSHT